MFPGIAVAMREWDDPIISRIGSVSELIEIAGGDDALPDLRHRKAAKDRIVAADAVRNNRIVEIKSPLILQPGPAALTDGLDAIVAALWPQTEHR